MPSTADLKRLVYSAIDSSAEEIVQISKAILQHPEPGFRELKTSKLVAEKFKELGVSTREGIAITGIKGELRGGGDGPSVALIGELDSLIVVDHPYADPDNGAAHACGHHAQIGMLIGATIGLMSGEVLSSLSGRLVLIAAPAEEYIEIEYRDTLRRQKKLEFLGGKPEFIRLGELDDVDIAMMCHTTSNDDDGKLCMSGTSNGILAKKIQFIGRGSHAGGRSTPGGQRTQRRLTGPDGYPREQGNIPGRGYYSSTPHHNQGGRSCQRCAGRRANGDLCQGQDPGLDY